jgi:hypothetical protein
LALGTESPFVNENVDILEAIFHAPGVGDEIRREVRAAKLHAAN